MRLYGAVAAMTFMASFGAYSVLQMSGAANAIGGTPVSTAGFFGNLNPLALLQPDRLRALVSSDTGIARSDPFRSKFDANAVRGLQPRFNFDSGRKSWTGPHYRPPVVPTTPSFRPYR